ncbi:GTPase-activating protein and VPS9 domain-containing protein 1 isoform X3 [Octopus bimaculoides]|uniref:GTPase-activating protein and VPS9 domain-containing protein 1 isoform X3 n=1 Tax=Octopus bimaculoides TaxID=37653 RepID=UPI00071D4FFF|nr:GTPase-activating protein and VPS9 domain-containing protein 1 isoform X3 [Octopus bimaculoides]|eukprot:XP_014779746.1 PREDICTED: GTPase-activating protein and VPS9 domain-containing protein 1-like isoform X3 [Octopus bimaculoides]
MSLAVQLEELAWQLKKERLFINSEREQMQKIYEDVKKVAEALYHVSWIMRQQRTNLEMLVTTIHGIVQSGFCAKAKQLESINFIDSYKQLGYHDIKFADLLKYLRDNPKLVAQLISCGEKRGIEGSQKVVGIVLPSLYGNCVMLEDEYMALQLLYTLAENQLTYDDNPRRLIRKGSCAFSKLFKNFFDSLFSSKLFLTAALHDPVMKLLMEDEWFYDIDPDKALVRFTPSERMRRFGEQGSTEWKTNLQNYRNFIVDKLVTLSNRFISAIKNNMYCFPVSLSWLVSQIYQLLSKSGKHSAAEVRAVCADLVFALFICPAIWDPAPYGIMSDVPISHIARHNLMQIAQIIQVLAFSQTDDIPPKFSDLYDKFDKGCLSGLIDIMLEGVGPDAPSVPSNHPQNIERSSVLITLTQLNTLVNFLRSTLPHMNKSNDINQLEELLSILPAIQTPTLTIQPSTPTSITPSHTPPGTPSSQRKTNRAHKKKMSLTNPEDVTVSSANVEQSHVDGSADLLEDVLVFSLGVTSECPGMLPECKVLSAEQERCRRKVTYQSSPTYEDNNAETHEKRTRFSFPQDQESIGNTSDIQEAISEVASSHSVGSLENDNDNFSDMISANVSGRGTPNVSGRDTPLSQAESVEERRAPDLPETVQKQNREDVTERFGKFEIKSELENETKSTVSDTWSTDVLASDSEGPDQNQLERLEEVTEEMVRQNLLGVAEPVSEVSETASDAWSTDVLASDTEEKQAELIQEIEQDDMNSVTDRSLNQDELESSCTLDRNEQTPLASGRESPDEERELEGLGAVGGVSSHRHRRSHGTDRVTFKDFDGDFKGEKKKGFFKSFKEKINKGMKKRGKSDRDDLFSEEFGACGDAFDGGGNGNFAGACVGNNVIGGKNFVCPETGDEILAKYRKKPNLPSSQSLDMTDDNQKDKHPTKEEQINEVPYYDPNNLENCFAFADAKRKLRLVLSVGDYQNCSIRYQTCGRWMPSSPCDNDGTPGSGGHWKETELVHILSVQLAEAINLRNKEMVAQLHEVIRCIKLFDNEGCKKLFKLLEEDYKGRAHYVAYLTRCKQGLLTSLYFLQGLLQRAQREKEICNNHLNNVCVQRFIESKDKLLSNFIADFQKLTMSDEKEDLVERFLNGLYQSIQTDALWQGCSESQLQSSCIALERYVMGRIYTHAMFPNGDGDILRDQLIHEHIKNLSQVISPTHKDLCIPKIYQFECPWPAAQREIHMINAYKTPKDKVQCVYRCSLCIMNLLSMANDRKVPAADDFFPVLIYVIIKANPPCLLSTIQYVNSFYGERVTGEEQYWWMQFFSAVKFIKTMD